MITRTRPYKLTQTRYAKHVIFNGFRKSWWLYILLPLFAFFNLKNFGKDSLGTFIVIFGFIYPFYSCIRLYFWTKSKDLNPIYEETNLSFDDENLFLEREGIENKIPFSSFQKIRSNKDCWLLYLVKGQFIYVPKNIFFNDDDSKRFNSLINNRNFG